MEKTDENQLMEKTDENQLKGKYGKIKQLLTLFLVLLPLKSQQLINLSIIKG